MTFSEQFINILNFIGQQIGVAVDWTSDNAMPYLKDLVGRYVNYEVASSIVTIILMLVLLVAVSLALRFITKKYKEYHFEYEFPFMIGWLVFAIVLILALIVILSEISDISDIIKALTIPEQLIIEKMMEVKSLIGR